MSQPSWCQDDKKYHVGKNFTAFLHGIYFWILFSFQVMSAQLVTIVQQGSVNPSRVILARMQTPHWMNIVILAPRVITVSMDLFQKWVLLRSYSNVVSRKTKTKIAKISMIDQVRIWYVTRSREMSHLSKNFNS